MQQLPCPSAHQCRKLPLSSLASVSCTPFVAALQGTRLACQVEYPNMAGTQIRTTLELRSTVRGANNRLDPLSIKSYDNAAAAPLSVGESLE